MDRFENQRWTPGEVAKLIAVFESERRFYEEIVTTLPVPLVTVGPGGMVLSANLTFLQEFRIDREELERKSLRVVFGDDEWQKALHRYETRSVSAGAYRAVFTPVPRWDRGETEWSVSFLLQTVAPPSSPTGVEAELVANTAAVAATQRLAARVTHEANNLVMIAAGYGREILAQLPVDSPLREDVSMLLQATGRVEAMATQLNEYSRAGRRTAVVCSLRDVLAETGFKVVPETVDASVLTDRTALAEVFAALPVIASGPLTLEVSLSAQEAVLTVKGFGVSAEVLRQHLEVLSKASRDGDRGAKAAAMIGPKLLQAGARWRVLESGSLELHLPLAGSVAAPAGRSVLVVDDQQGIRAIIRRILETRGYRVAEAGSGEEAASMLDRQSEGFDLVVTDMRMQGMTGRDLAERVRFRHPACRILFISGFTDDPAIQSGILPERSRFLSKPFHPEQLAEAVAKLMEQK